MGAFLIEQFTKQHTHSQTVDESLQGIRVRAIFHISSSVDQTLKVDHIRIMTAK